MTEAVLAIDVGSGTQDILLYLPGKNLENCPKMVMPSQTQIVAQRIRQVTVEGRDLFLSGVVMGGGASTVALKAHLQAGLKAYATPAAAKTFHDNLENVKALGVEMVEENPGDAFEVRLGDLDLAGLRRALEEFGLEFPKRLAVAVQDHGETVVMSNREFRFRFWREFISGGGELDRLIYDRPPAYFTRMGALQDLDPGCKVMDTGAAAVWGILSDPIAGAMRDKGLIALNIGNSHTLGLAIKGTRVLGLFEHHTGQINPGFLLEQVKKFQAGDLTNQEVFGRGGHGAYLHPDFRGGFEFVALTGPRWAMARDFGFYRAAPFGDMMLTGCFGLLAAMGLISMDKG